VETVAVHNHGAEALHQALRDFAASPRDTDIIRMPAEHSSVENSYHQIESLMSQFVVQPDHSPAWQDKMDAVVMHPVLGLFILFGILLVIFQAVFAWAAPVMEVIEASTEFLGDSIMSLLPEGILQDFLVNELISGVGGVVVFLLQIVILFFFILVLEDSGYLTRAAFLLDRPMRGIGLSGRSFIPLLSSFGCAVPGVMA